jgi:very-short-patch-repair endonuclease
VNAEAVALAIEPLPQGAPTIVTYFTKEAHTAAEMVAEVLNELEAVAIGLFPAWLPGAEGIGGPQGANPSAVRTLALRLASATHHFGPFLADLAERALGGAVPSGEDVTGRSTRFAPEVRAAGLARVLAASFHRSHASILVRVPMGLPPDAEEALVAGCEWLAHRGGLGVWLTGAPLTSVDRVEAITIRLPADLTDLTDLTDLADLARDEPDAPEPPEAEATPVIGYPAVAGTPHPASGAEQALEAALARCDWAAGRAWNQTYQPNPLATPIRVDLLWRRERCIVEIDGPEHRAPLRFAADRRRDVQLQVDGYVVLRFTNAHVMTDTEAVLRQMELLLQGRRLGTLEG